MIVQNTSSQTVSVASSLPIASPEPVAPIHAPVVTEAPIASSTTQPQVSIISSDTLTKTVAAANVSLNRAGSTLHFSIDSSTDTAVVTMVDKGTGEVIRQFPSEEALAIARSIDEILARSASLGGSGILYQQTA